MNFFMQDVPIFMARCLGHVCGMIFVVVAAVSLWLIYMFVFEHRTGALIVFVPTSLIAYFFGRVAFKLIARTKSKLFSKRALLAIQLLMTGLSLLMVVLALIKFRNDEIESLKLAITLLTSGACGLLSMQFRKLINKNY